MIHIFFESTLKGESNAIYRMKNGQVAFILSNLQNDHKLTNSHIMCVDIDIVLTRHL